MENENKVVEKEIKEPSKEEKAVKEEPKKQKKKVGRIIIDVAIFLLFIVIILEAAIGIINMQKLNNDEKPVWYISTRTNKTDKKEQTIYNLGLYKIVKTDTAKKTTIQLKPFFIGD